MARKERRDNSKLRELMQEYGVKTMEDVHNFVKMLAAETIQTALDAELESDLGYSKYDYKNEVRLQEAVTEESALLALDELEAKWGSKYALGVKSWRVNWPELSTMFKYPPEIRILIYTTSAIENFNRQLRKVTKTKSSSFPTTPLSRFSIWQL